MSAPALPPRDPIDWSRSLEFVLSFASISPSLERAAEARQLLECDPGPRLADLDPAWLPVIEAARDWLSAVDLASRARRPLEIPRFTGNDILRAAIATRPPVAPRSYCCRFPAGRRILAPETAQGGAAIEDRPPAEYAWQRRADLAG